MFDEIIMSVSTNPIDIDWRKVENGEKNVWLIYKH